MSGKRDRYLAKGYQQGFTDGFRDGFNAGFDQAMEMALVMFGDLDEIDVMTGDEPQDDMSGLDDEGDEGDDA